MRVNEPMTDVQITASGDIVKMKKQIVKPSEMIEIKLDTDKLAKVRTLKEFKIDVRKHD
jgi:hypothetical protein